jgi:signal peptidase I
MLKVEQLNFKKTLKVSILFFLFGAGVVVLGLLLQMLGAGRVVINIFFLLANLSIGVWLIRKKFMITLRRSVGVYLIFVVLSAVITLLVSLYVVKAAYLPPRATSMEPAILPGDHVLINKLAYCFKEPGRGDLIVFVPPKGPSRIEVKRLIALPGEVVEIRDGTIRIDRKRLDEFKDTPFPSYYTIPSGTNFPGSYGPVAVSENSYFVLGDNLAHSADSRTWGFVHRDNVVGKAGVVYWSIDKNSGRIRWNRIGKSLP